MDKKLRKIISVVIALAMMLFMMNGLSGTFTVDASVLEPDGSSLAVEASGLALDCSMCAVDASGLAFDAPVLEAGALASASYTSVRAVDFSFPSGGWNMHSGLSGTDTEVIQAFSPAVSGRLNQVGYMVRLNYHPRRHPVGGLKLNVYEVNEAQTPSALLGTVIIPPAEVVLNNHNGGFADFSHLDIYLEAGRMYAVGFTQDFTNHDVEGRDNHLWCSCTYAPGTAPPWYTHHAWNGYTTNYYDIVHANIDANPPGTFFRHKGDGQVPGTWVERMESTFWLQVYVETAMTAQSELNVDYSWTPPPTGWRHSGGTGMDAETGQIFMPTKSGRLDNLDLMVAVGNQVNAEDLGDLVVRVYNANAAGLLPSGAPLGTVIIPRAQIPLVDSTTPVGVTADFGPLDIHLNAFARYAVTVSQTTLGSGYYRVLQNSGAVPSNPAAEFRALKGDGTNWINDFGNATMWMRLYLTPDLVQPTVASIDVVSTNHQTDYIVGAPLNLNNLMIRVRMSNGVDRIIPVTEEMVSGFDSSTPGVNRPITITYGSRTTSFFINIRPPDTGGVVDASIDMRGSSYRSVKIDHGAYGRGRSAMEFDLIDETTIESITMHLRKVNDAPHDLIIAIHSMVNVGGVYRPDNAGEIARIVVPHDSVTNVMTEYTFEFDEPVRLAAGKYALVFHVPGNTYDGLYHTNQRTDISGFWRHTSGGPPNYVWNGRWDSDTFNILINAFSGVRMIRVCATIDYRCDCYHVIKIDHGHLGRGRQAMEIEFHRPATVESITMYLRRNETVDSPDLWIAIHEMVNVGGVLRPNNAAELARIIVPYDSIDGTLREYTFTFAEPVELDAGTFAVMFHVPDNTLDGLYHTKQCTHILGPWRHTSGGPPTFVWNGRWAEDAFNIVVNAFMYIPDEYYTITFETFGGSVVPPLENLRMGDPITRPVPDPHKTGYVFLGWHTQAENMTQANLFNFATARATRSMTLYARWAGRGEPVVVLDNGVPLAINPTPDPIWSGLQGGIDVGILTNSDPRAVSFQVDMDGKLGEVELVVNSSEGRLLPGGDGKTLHDVRPLSDLIVTVWMCDTSTWTPVMEIGRIIVPVDETFRNTNRVLTVDFSELDVELQAGGVYAIGISQVDPVMHGEAGAFYHWPGGRASNVNTFKRDGISGSWSRETHNFWLRVYQIPGDVAQRIDYTWDNPGIDGLPAGVAGTDIERFQTFTSTVSGAMVGFRVWLNKWHEVDPMVQEVNQPLIARLYATDEYGLPTGEPLRTQAIPMADLGIDFDLPAGVSGPALGGFADILFPFEGLVEGTRYALSLSADPLAPSIMVGDHYIIPHRINPAADGEFAGRRTDDGFVIEDVGTMNIQFSLTGSTARRPTRIEPVENEILYIPLGASVTPSFVVFDQNDEVIENARVNLHVSNPAIATALGNTITARDNMETRGRTTAIAMSGLALTTVHILTYESLANKIEGAPNIAIALGETAQAKYTVWDEFRNVYTGNYELTFSIENPAIATVNADGLITPVAAGETVMTVSTNALDFLSRPLFKRVSISVYNDADPTLVTPYNNMLITESVRFRPGVYVLPDGIRIGASGITIDGNGAIIQSTDPSVPPVPANPRWSPDIEWPTQRSGIFDRFQIYTLGYSGTGVRINGFDNVTVKNLTARYYLTGLQAQNANGLEIRFNNFSRNFNNRDFGWGDGPNYGGIWFNNVHNSLVEYNKANHNWNAIRIDRSDHNIIRFNEFGIAANVNLWVHESSYNRIHDNIMNWGIRVDPGEVHARDSSSNMFEGRVMYNYIARNCFVNGGNGTFVRPLHGKPQMGNLFLENNNSWANNNAIESWSPGNAFIGNINNFSSYGIWTGGSDFSFIINNIVVGHGGVHGGRANAPEPFGNAGITNARGGSNNHYLIMGNEVRDGIGPGIAIINLTHDSGHNPNWPAYHTLIQNNTIKNNTGHGIYTRFSDFTNVISNHIHGNTGLNGVHIDMTPSQTGGRVSNIFVHGDNDGLAIEHRPIRMADLPTLDVMVSETLADYTLADKHWDNIPQEIKDHEFGIVPIRYLSVRQGETITFTAHSNQDVTYQWSIERERIFAGPGATYTLVRGYEQNFTVTFDVPGTFRGGVTILGEELGNMNGFIITVVPAGREIGTNRPVSEWTITGGGPTTVARNIPFAVEGNSAIQVEAISTGTGTNRFYTLRYPAVGAPSLGGLEGEILSLFYSITIERAGLDQQRRPIIRLHVDDNNFITYTPTMAFLSPIQLNNRSEARYSYWYLEMDLNASNAMFNRTVTGSVALADIQFITIEAGPNHSNARTIFSISGMRLNGVGVDDTYYTMTFHLYSANTRILDAFGDYATAVVDGRPVIIVPVQPGTAPALGNVLNLGHIYGTSDNHGYAFRGWFSDEMLDESGRTREGLRRPALAIPNPDEDTCPLADLLELIENGTAEEFGALFGSGNLDLYGVWVRFGDVDDNGEVNMSDLGLLQRHINFAHIMPVAFSVAASDVVVDGVINMNDLTLLQRHTNLGHIVPVVLGAKPQP